MSQRLHVSEIVQLGLLQTCPEKQNIHIIFVTWLIQQSLCGDLISYILKSPSLHINYVLGQRDKMFDNPFFSLKPGQNKAVLFFHYQRKLPSAAKIVQYHKNSNTTIVN